MYIPGRPPFITVVLHLIFWNIWLRQVIVKLFLNNRSSVNSNISTLLYNSNCLSENIQDMIKCLLKEYKLHSH